MTKEGQNQVSDLTIQKDKGQISKENIMIAYQIL